MEKFNENGFCIEKDNFEKIKKLFPQCIVDGKIDFEMLKTTLGEYVENDNEKYSFDWIGKNMAIRNAQSSSKGTLIACKEKSKFFDSTNNIYIEGDNLEALKILSKTYHKKVKMIYIDPPYNTGHDFVYKDDFVDSIGNYLEVSSQKNKTNADTSGRYHTDWLNMMYSRLMVCKSFLTDDGVIFLSIDDNEQANLKKICDEIFGADNFITSLIWSAGRKNDSKYISVSHEYILCYVNSLSTLTERGILWREKKKGLDDIYSKYDELCKKYGSNYQIISNELKKWFKSLGDDNPAKAHSHYSLVDDKGIFFADNASWPGGGGPKYEVLHPITKKPVKIPSRGWIYSSPERMQEMIDAGKVYFGPDETYVPCIKSYLKDREFSTPYSVFYKDGRAATKRLRDLLGGMYFQNPKDEDIIKSLINLTLSNNDSIIMDFFSGSATTAQAVMQINAEDGGDRKFILVQLPELLDEKDDAFNDGYKTICDLGEERIKRAGEKIKADLIEKRNNAGLLADTLPIPEKLDIGFKVFRLDSTNIVQWDGTNKIDSDSLFNLNKVIKDGRNPEDVAYEIMLKYGIFDKQLEKITINNKTIFSVDNSSMIIILETIFEEADIKELIRLSPSVVVFDENCFAGDDNLKQNTEYTLKHYLGDDEIKVLCI